MLPCNYVAAGVAFAQVIMFMYTFINTESVDSLSASGSATHAHTAETAVGE